MEQINLLKAERIKVENLLNNLYPQQTYGFKSSDHTRLTFQIGEYELDFLYPKERYEPEDEAVFKGVMIGNLKESTKKYPVNQVLSFFDNNCDTFEDSYRIDSLSCALEKSLRLIEILKSEIRNFNWQEELDIVIKKKYPW